MGRTSFSELKVEFRFANWTFVQLFSLTVPLNLPHLSPERFNDAFTCSKLTASFDQIIGDVHIPKTFTCKSWLLHSIGKMRARILDIIE